MAADLPRALQWAARPELMAWMAQSRLDLIAGLATLEETDVKELAELERYRRNLAPAIENLQRLLAQTGAPRAA
jgi:hypothetical protein